MGKINILEPKVFNRIAAGEVVERPASIVKELIENSLDAGATNIRIEILDGGIKQIKISDNGLGIDFDDIDKVFLPHATSKIATVDDLDKIDTLGFRGEALASVASVAQVELISKTANSKTGASIEIESGTVTEKTEKASPDGTYLTVNNLFYNIPARQKFLRKPKTEETQITNLISRYILANPSISFTYFANNKEIFRSTGKNLEEAIYTVYGKETLNSLIPFSTKNNDICLSGYLGKPTFAKSNRTYQTLIINGRYVINGTVASAVYSAYQSYLMKGKFPFFIINIDMPLTSLDVNVHPNKLDVKFENSQAIYRSIYNTVIDTLMNASNILQVNTPIAKTLASKTITPINTYEKTAGLSFNKQEQTLNAPKQTILNSNKNINIVFNNLENKTKVLSSFEILNNKNQKSNGFNQNSSILTNALNKALSEEKITTNKQVTPQAQISAFENVIDNFNINYIGKLFNTYLLIEKDKSLFIVDQHAAHERLLYDKLTKEIDSKKISSQMLLIPHILTVNYLEEEFLQENLKALESLGFDIESFGSLSFKVSSIPALLNGFDINMFFDDILKNMHSFKASKNSNLITDKLKQSSCKAAVKGGDALSKNEVSILFNKMHDSNMTLLCPHGRPVIIEVTNKEIEKWFKRIV